MRDCILMDERAACGSAPGRFVFCIRERPFGWWRPRLAPIGVGHVGMCSRHRAPPYTSAHSRQCAATRIGALLARWGETCWPARPTHRVNLRIGFVLPCAVSFARSPTRSQRSLFVMAASCARDTWKSAAGRGRACVTRIMNGARRHAWRHCKQVRGVATESRRSLDAPFCSAAGAFALRVAPVRSSVRVHAIQRARNLAA